MPEVLWIDDAAGYMLQPIARMLKRRGHPPTVLTAYQEAIEEIERISEVRSETGGGLPNVIVDLLIPRAKGGTLDSIEVGFALARRSAELGAQRIIIFTVVSQMRVSVEYSRLKEDYDQTQFYFLEKTIGGPSRLVNALVRFLSGDELTDRGAGDDQC